MAEEENEFRVRSGIRNEFQVKQTIHVERELLELGFSIWVSLARFFTSDTPIVIYTYLEFHHPVTNSDTLLDQVGKKKVGIE